MNPEIKISYEDALKAFFDYNLKPGMAYGTDGYCCDTELPNDTLVYQDGTACSGSFAFSNVFLTSNGSYTVITRMSGCGERKIIKTECKTLTNVLDELANYNFGDSNSTGDMLTYFFGRKQMCNHINSGKSFSELFKNDMEEIIKLNDLSLKGMWIYNKRGVGYI